MLGRRGKEEKKRERGRIRMKEKGVLRKMLWLFYVPVDRVIIPVMIVASSPHKN